MLLAAWCWRCRFFRRAARDRLSLARVVFLLPLFLSVWYVLAVGTRFFLFVPDTKMLTCALRPYLLALEIDMFPRRALECFRFATLLSSLTALTGWGVMARPLSGTTERTRGTGILLSITGGLAIICAASYGWYRMHMLEKDKTTQAFRDETSVKYHPQAEAAQDATDLSAYVPFSSANKLVVVESPGLCITNDPPLLHGALALYPVYAAAVHATYRDNAIQNHLRFVRSGTSPEAFNALLANEEWWKCDMAFMLYPSEKQLAEARKKGKTLEVTKIGREAFVFFVSRVNPVDNLTSVQIRDIYGKRVTNWLAVGGKDERILPFQRPEGTGSQTAMEQFMGDAPLAKPIQEERKQMMDGIRVADYRNYGNAIGFSFRYYVEGMFKHDGVKLLAVDGVMPTAENIRSGAYPLVADVVIVTAGSTNPNVKALTDWFLSPKGQELLEKVGYVPLQGEP